MNEKLSKIRKAVWRAVDTLNIETIIGIETLNRPIRLADVLLACHISHIKHCKKGYESNWKLLCFEICFFWNWAKNDLNDQSEETISFLHELLK